jgi:hypothetical protein
MDATSHGSLDEWSKELVLDGSLVLHESTFGVSIDRGDVLEIALTSLVANWAVKGMVGKQELHDATPGNSGLLRLGDNLEVWSHISGARSNWLWASFDLDETHAAITCHGQPLVITETWDLNSSQLAGLVNGV